MPANTSIILLEGTKGIAGGAFYGRPGLASITIPNSVTNIGEFAFVGCTNLTNITIPNSVTSIGWRAFGNCTSLTEITVDASNTVYTSQDGVLYNKTKTTLVAYPGGKTGAFTIPNSVIGIGDSAFRGCTSLTSVTFPNSVTVIGDSAFYGCTSLTSVTFATGSNITNTNFGNLAFPVGSYENVGDSLKNAYLASNPKAGTYTRAENGDTWTKQP